MTQGPSEKELRDAHKSLDRARQEGHELIAWAETQAIQHHRTIVGSEAIFEGRTVTDEEIDSKFSSLDLLVGATGVLCFLPDDPLDAAEAYIDSKVEFFNMELELEAHSRRLGVEGDELEKGLEALRIMIAAEGSVHQGEANLTGGRLIDELSKRTAEARLQVDKAFHTIKEAPRVARRAALLNDVFIVAALLAVSIVSFGVGYLAGELVGLWGQAVVALLLFVVLDRTFVDRLLEPSLKRRRRRTLIGTAKRLASDYRDAEVALARVPQV